MKCSIGDSVGSGLSDSFDGATPSNCRRLASASAEFVRRWGHMSPEISGSFSGQVSGSRGPVPLSPSGFN